jgi:hypothetical protein
MMFFITKQMKKVKNTNADTDSEAEWKKQRH